MTFDKLYDPLRALLGDRQVHGNWNYTDPMLTSAIKSVFLLNRGPERFKLNDTQDAITPDFDPDHDGDKYALTVYQAALLLIGGEDGAYRIHTRAVSVVDSGDRKKDLMRELHRLIYETRDAVTVFTTYQDFRAWLGAGMPFAREVVVPPAQSVGVTMA
jgi:hypothetical protein